MPFEISRNRPRARSTCYACGLRDPRNACVVSPRAHLHEFDHSKHTYQAAKRVIREGESKLAELSKAINRLRSRKKQLQRVVRRHRPFLAVVHRLPDEVLLMIFEEVSGPFDGIQLYRPHKLSTPPWIVAAVCQRWRRIAISSSCSHLWKNIYLDHDTTSLLPHLLHVNQRVKAQVDRAKSCPLDVIVFLPFSSDEDGPCDPSVQTTFRNELSFVLPKCSSAQMTGNNEYWAAIPPLAEELPLLKELSMLGMSWLDALRSVSLPNLEWLDIRGDYVASIPQLWYSNLSVLSLRNDVLRLPSIIRALRGAKELEQLIIDDIQWGQIRSDSQAIDPTSMNMPVQAGDEIHLPLLDYLLIDLKSEVMNPILQPAPGAHQLLRQLRAPKIDSLALKRPQSSHDFLAVLNFVMISGSASCISELKIREPSAEDIFDGLIHFLAHLPLLEKLTVVALPGDTSPKSNVDKVLIAPQWLSPGNSRECEPSSSNGPETENDQRNIVFTGVCPRLELIFLSHVIMDSNQLKSMVESRARGPDDVHQEGTPRRLQSVVTEGLVFTDNPATNTPDSAEQLPWMVDLVENGFI